MRFDAFDRLFSPEVLAAQVREAVLQAERDFAPLAGLEEDEFETYLQGLELGYVAALEREEP